MYENIEDNTNKVTDWLTLEMRSIHTGMATPMVLDHVKVEAYGSWMSLSHVAAINIEDAKTLRVMPFDKSQIRDIEKAINEADLGLSVGSDSDGVRVSFPSLTTERRTQYVKMAKERLEEARVRVRAIRDEVKKDIEARAKDGEYGEDDKKSMLQSMQSVIDMATTTLDHTFTKKEKEVMGNI